MKPTLGPCLCGGVATGAAILLRSRRFSCGGETSVCEKYICRFCGRVPYYHGRFPNHFRPTDTEIPEAKTLRASERRFFALNPADHLRFIFQRLRRTKKVIPLTCVRRYLRRFGLPFAKAARSAQFAVMPPLYHSGGVRLTLSRKLGITWGYWGYPLRALGAYV